MRYLILLIYICSVQFCSAWSFNVDGASYQLIIESEGTSIDGDEYAIINELELSASMSNPLRELSSAGTMTYLSISGGLLPGVGYQLEIVSRDPLKVRFSESQVNMFSQQKEILAKYSVAYAGFESFLRKLFSGDKSIIGQDLFYSMANSEVSLEENFNSLLGGEARASSLYSSVTEVEINGEYFPAKFFKWKTRNGRINNGMAIHINGDWKLAVRK